MSSAKSLIHPGEILSETFLKPLEISRSRLAMDIGVPVSRIHAIINGTRQISLDTAVRLGRYFCTGAKFWIDLQIAYGLGSMGKPSGGEFEKIPQLFKI